MNNYRVLVRVLLKDVLYMMGFDKENKKKAIKKYLLGIVIILCLLPTALGIAAMVYNSYDILNSIQQQGILLSLGFNIITLMVFFFGIFYILNVFYFAGDIENLIPLPLLPSEILAAKFTVTLIYEYMTELLFFAPIIIAFGIKSNGGIVFYLYGLLMFLLLPVIPLVYASIINMIIMRFTNLAKNKDKFKIIGGMMGMLLAVGLNFYVQKISSVSTNQQQLISIIEQGNNSLIKLMTGIFPTNTMGVYALLESSNSTGLFNLLSFVAATVLFLVLFLLLGEKIYFKGVTGISQAYTVRKKVKQQSNAKVFKQSTAVGAIYMRELKLLVRTPVYFLNCVMMNFLWPFFIVIPIITQNEEMKKLGDLGAYFQNSSIAAIFLASAVAASLFATGTNCITATAISREGSNLFISKYIPVSYKKQIIAKVLSGFVLGLVGTVMMIITALMIVRVPIFIICLVFIASIFAILFSCLCGIIIDLNYPKLHWDNEQKAVKQNLNAVINIFISIIIAVITVWGTVVLKLDLLVTFMGIVSIYGIFDIVLYRLATGIGAKLFGEIEE